MEYKTTRDITTKECSWLNDTILKDTTVFSYQGCTYGCLSSNGVAVSFDDGEEPFFELPEDSLYEL